MKESFVFIYTKKGKIKCLSLDESIKQHSKLLESGWTHTRTIDACMYIMGLYEHEPSDLINEIKALRHL